MQKSQDRRRWLIIAGISAVVVGAYAAGGFLGVPALVDSEAREFVRASYGRELVLGKVRFNPFTLALEVEKLEIPDADGNPLLGFDRLDVNLGLSSLWRRALSFQSIRLDGLDVNAVIRPGGALNLADLVPKPATTASPPAADTRLPRVVIDDLAINEGQLRYEDRNRPTPFVTTVSPVTFRLENFSTYASGERYQLDARLFASGSLAWRGSLSVQPVASQGEFRLSDVPLPEVARLLGAVVPLEVAAGTASLRGEYHLAAGDFSIDDGEIGISGLAVRPRGGETDYIRLARVMASGLKLGLAGKQAEIGKLAVNGGRIDAWLSPGGELNLMALAGAGAGAGSAEVGNKNPGPTPPASTPPASTSPAVDTPRKESPWVVRVPAVQVEDLALHLEDRQVRPAATLDLDPLQLTISGFSTAPGSVLDSRLTATINRSGHAAVTASTKLDSLDTTADIDATDLPLDIAQPYVAAATSMTLTGGTLSVKGTVTHAAAAPDRAGADAAPGTRFDGNVAIDRLHTIDNALKEDFVKWDQLKLEDLHYQSAPQRLRIRAIDLRRPYARVVIAPDGTSNVSAILAGPGATAAAAPGPTFESPPGDARPPAPPVVTKAPATAGRGPIPFPVRIDAIRIANGSARFADLTTRPNFDIGIGKLDGTISGLSSAAGSRARVVLDGEVDEFSPVTIRGDLNPLAAETFMDLSMTLRNMELASFTPYSGRFAGYSIRKGKLSAELHYLVQDHKLDADHKFVIDQFELGDKVDSPDATALPLKLAVALLKDRNGVIDLDLPVTGDLDDPQFRVGPIVWKVFVNLVTKAATAPFALLGKLFGGGDEINQINFAPGKATLDAASNGRIDALVKALTERPGLKLSVPATFDRAVDAPALKETALEQQVIRFVAKPGTSTAFATIAGDPKAYRKILDDLYRQAYGQKFTPPGDAEGQDAGQAADQDAAQADPVIPLLETALRDKIVVGDNELFALATARATAIKQRLLTDTGIDPARVFLTAPAEGAASAAGVVLELALR